MSRTLGEPVRTPSLASQKEELEPPSSDTGRQELAETASSIQDSLSCPPSTVEEANSSENTEQLSLANRLKRALRPQSGSSKHLEEYRYGGKVEQVIPKLDHYIVGYSKLAAVEDCDPHFLIYRKFGWLRNCSLLYLQDQLVELEEDLKALDRYEFIEEPRKLVSRRRNEGPKGIERRELLTKIKEKLAEYDESLFRLQRIQAMRRPTKRNQKSLANFISNTGSQAADEAGWIRRGTDLVAVAHDQEHGWLIGFLEDTLLKLSRNLAIAIFRTPEQKIITGQEPVTLLSAARLDILLRAAITVCASIALLTPIFILFGLQPRRRTDVERNTYCQILIIFVFTLGFSALCSIFTKAKRQEVFAATAAYAAVLVVFLGNSGSLVMSSQA